MKTYICLYLLWLLSLTIDFLVTDIVTVVTCVFKVALPWLRQKCRTLCIFPVSSAVTHAYLLS